MSLSDRAREAREHADRTGLPGDVMLAEALESAERAEAQRLIQELQDPPDLTGIPNWS
jgi:hypothetical protein